MPIRVWIDLDDDLVKSDPHIDIGIVPDLFLGVSLNLDETKIYCRVHAEGQIRLKLEKQLGWKPWKGYNHDCLAVWDLDPDQVVGQLRRIWPTLEVVEC